MTDVQSPQHLLRQIETDRQHGATELALLAIDGIATLAQDLDPESTEQLKQSLLKLISNLKACRPSMAPMENLLSGLRDRLACISGSELQALRFEIVNACNEVMSFTVEAQEAAVRNMAAHIENDDVIMTHSVSSTIKKLCEHLVDNGIQTRFVITESRPGDEGKLLAEFLANLGIPTTYITESQVDLLMPEIDKVVVGADSILQDGSAINKSGSTLIGLSARYHSVPFYVCAEAFKLRQNDEFALEQMNSDELGLDIPGVDVRNVYFERVPTELITEWIL